MASTTTRLMQRARLGAGCQPASTARLVVPVRRPVARRAATVRATKEDAVGAAATAAIAAGLVASPIVLWSAYTLKTTGAGLQGDVLGAAEGVSYLIVLGIVAWSVYTKATTGSGLPAGPSGLLGAVEGFSYLALLAAVLAYVANAAGF